MNSKEHIRFLREAKLCACSAPNFGTRFKPNSWARFKHGALLVKNGVIISRGYNTLSISSNPQIKMVEKFSGIRLTFSGIGTIHAEIACLINVGLRQDLIRNSTLYIFGISRAGNVIKSRPCPRCLKALYFMRIKQVVYSNQDGSFTIENLT